MNISNISSQISQNIFSKLDTEDQGYLSQEVLSSAFDSLNSSAADSDAESLVTAMDSDSDGQITKSELTQGVENLLSQLGQSQQRPPMGGPGGMGSMGGMPPPPPPSGGKGGGEDLSVTAEEAATLAESTDDENLSEIMSQISENFDEADTDGDGVVTQEEGMAFHQSQREATRNQIDEGVTAEQAAEIAANSGDGRLSEIMTQISDNFSEVDADEDGIVTREEGMAFSEAQREAEAADLNSRFDLAAMENVAKLITAYGFDLSETESSVSTTA